MVAVDRESAPAFQDRFKLFQHKQLLIYADILSLFAQMARFLRYLSVNKYLHWSDT